MTTSRHNNRLSPRLTHTRGKRRLSPHDKATRDTSLLLPKRGGDRLLSPGYTRTSRAARWPTDCMGTARATKGSGAGRGRGRHFYKNERAPRRRRVAAVVAAREPPGHTGGEVCVATWRGAGGGARTRGARGYPTQQIHTLAGRGGASRGCNSARRQRYYGGPPSAGTHAGHGDSGAGRGAQVTAARCISFLSFITS